VFFADRADHGPLQDGLAPEARIIAAIGFVGVVAFTPPRWAAAFAVYTLVVVGAVGALGVSPTAILRRLTVLGPFLVLALLLPVIGTGDRMSVLGVALSVDGLWSGWGIAAKGTIGTVISAALAGTTPTARILLGLQRLRVPALMITIAALMIRYVGLIGDDMARMRTAMIMRGHDPRWIWQLRPLARSAGASFVRSFERGERVHAAMLARGFTGSMPELGDRRAGWRDWFLASIGPMLAAAGLAIGWYVEAWS